MDTEDEKEESEVVTLWTWGDDTDPDVWDVTGLDVWDDTDLDVGDDTGWEDSEERVAGDDEGYEPGGDEFNLSQDEGENALWRVKQKIRLYKLYLEHPEFSKILRPNDFEPSLCRQLFVVHANFALASEVSLLIFLYGYLVSYYAYWW